MPWKNIHCVFFTPWLFHHVKFASSFFFCTTRWNEDCFSDIPQVWYDNVLFATDRSGALDAAFVRLFSQSLPQTRLIVMHWVSWHLPTRTSSKKVELTFFQVAFWATVAFLLDQATQPLIPPMSLGPTAAHRPRLLPLGHACWPKGRIPRFCQLLTHQMLARCCLACIPSVAMKSSSELFPPPASAHHVVPDRCKLTVAIKTHTLCVIELLIHQFNCLRRATWAKNLLICL